MAITVADVAVSLRLIGDNTQELPPGLLAILTRYVGVAEAHTGLIVPSAPEAVQDEIIIRMASYLYDQPPAARGLNYANAWGNSGAAALAHRWVSQHVAGETGGDGSTGIPPVGGLTVEEVEALADCRSLGPPARLSNAGKTPPRSFAISTTQIKIRLPRHRLRPIAASAGHRAVSPNPPSLDSQERKRCTARGRGGSGHGQCDRYGEYALLIVADDTPPKPWNYSTGNYESVWVSNFGDLLRRPDSTIVAGAIGGHGLGENQPLRPGL